MHMKPIHYLLFVLIMGPLIWFSSKMRWGPTGTMMCVIVAIVLGFVIIVSSKRVSRRLRRSLGTNRAEAANFLFGPTHPGIRKQEIRQAHQQVVARTRVGEWRAPTMLQQTRPQMPDPQRRPAAVLVPTVRGASHHAEDHGPAPTLLSNRQRRRPARWLRARRTNQPAGA